jgi:hypothetical protein
VEETVEVDQVVLLLLVETLLLILVQAVEELERKVAQQETMVALAVQA